MVKTSTDETWTIGSRVGPWQCKLSFCLAVAMLVLQVEAARPSTVGTEWAEAHGEGEGVWDETPPSIGNAVPMDGSILSDPMPTVFAIYGDDKSGVNHALTVLHVDGADRTAEADVGKTRIEWHPLVPLGDGEHMVNLSVTDFAGNQANLAWGFTVDTVPPACDIEALPDPHVSETGVVEVGLTYSDAGSGVDLSSFRISVDGDPFEGGCQILANEATCLTPQLATGSYALVASIRDTAGNPQETQATLNLIVDTDSPIVEIHLPHDGSVHIQPLVEISGMAIDDGPFDRLELNGEVIPHTDGQFALERTMVEGPNAYTVTAYDQVGRSGSDTNIAILDTLGPSVTDLEPADGSFVADTTPTVSAALSDLGTGVDPSSVQLLVDSVDRTSEATVTSTSVEWTPSTALAEGAHSLELRVEDMMDRLTVVEWSFGIDTASPIVTIDPFEDPFLSDSPEVEVSLSFLDGGVAGSGVDGSSLEISIDGAPFESSCTVLAAAATCLTPPLATGPHSIVASIADLAGNEGTDTEPLNVIVDVAAPVVEILTPVDGSYQNVTTVEISGTVTDDGPIDRIELNGAVIPLTEGEFSVQRELVEGQNVFAVVAFDEVGRSGQDSTTAGLDTIVPSATLTTPIPDAHTQGDTSNVEVTWSDQGSGIAVETGRLWIDGVEVTNELQATAENATWNGAGPWPEGIHAIEIEIGDGVGNLHSQLWSFTVDRTPPVTGLHRPQGSLIQATGDVVLQFAAIDPIGLLDDGGTEVTVDGAALPNESCTHEEFLLTCSSAGLSSGQHAIAITLVDLAGNEASSSATFDLVVDAQPPVVNIAQPESGAILAEPSVLVSGTAFDDGAVEQLRVQGNPVALNEVGEFSAVVSLREGANEINVTASDTIGREATVSSQVILDTTGPSVEIDTPAPNETLSSTEVRVAGPVADEAGVAAVTVNGVPAALGGGFYEAEVPLAAGTNILSVFAVDGAGNQSERAVTVSRFLTPSLQITSPSDYSTIAASVVDILGAVDATVTGVLVNGLTASLENGTFSVTDVPLVEGANQISAVAVNGEGGASSATITVIRDLEAPRISIDFPEDGFETDRESIELFGSVHDLVRGTIATGEVVVSVNGAAATVDRTGWYLGGVALAVGSNELEIEAADVSGNVSSKSITVSRTTEGSRKLEILSGQNQTSIVGTELPSPLRIRALDEVGAPLAGVSVLYRVKRGDGHFVGGGRTQLAVTGPTGEAEARFVTGGRAGFVSQLVEAAASGFSGSAVFAASVLPGAPTQVVVDSGDQQVGAAGEYLPRPLAVAVLDGSGNRLAGVRVRFVVLDGGGRFSNGEESIEIGSDSDGRVIATLRLGSTEGVANNRTRVDLPDHPTVAPAYFAASSWVVGAVEETAFTGLVLDNQLQPVPGVTIRFREYPSTVGTTGPDGVFQILPSPVGSVHVIVDGSTTTRPGSWADLEFEATLLPGRENSLGMPIFLLPLDIAGGIYVSETVGGSIEMDEAPGFRLDIAPGSATFPGGSRTGVVSATLVHADRVPMPPNLGQQPSVIVTIQPAGTRFDPPARIQFPNVSGLAPGRVVDLYSFDHELGAFVSIGAGAVSEDGLVIASGPGFGIVKAGWHAPGGPLPAGTAHGCGEGYSFAGGACACDPAACAAKSDACSGYSCVEGRCERTEVAKIRSVKPFIVHEAKSTACVGRPVQFDVDVVAEHCEAFEYLWTFSDDGSSSSVKSPSHTFLVPGEPLVTVEVTCATCPSATALGGKLPRVVEEERFRMRFANFIPFPYAEPLPPPMSSGWLCYPVFANIYEGDNRGFTPTPPAKAYRTVSEVVVIPQQACDDDGLAEAVYKETGVTRLFARDAVIDGDIDPEDHDGVLFDCHLLHDEDEASVDEFSVEVSERGEESLTLKVNGDANNPLTLLTCAISWNFNVKFDAASSARTVGAAGVHDCFPAHELYVNNEPIHQFSPPSPQDLVACLCSPSPAVTVEDVRPLPSPLP